MISLRAIKTDFIFLLGPNQLLNKQSNDRWFEATWRSCDIIVIEDNEDNSNVDHHDHKTYVSRHSLQL